MNQPVMKANPLKRVQIERISEQVLKDFCSEALTKLMPINIEKMFELYIPKRFQVATSYEELSFGIHGYTDPNNLKAAVSVKLIEANDLATTRFGRSTIGHEVGHVVLHATQFRKKNLELRFLHDDNHSKTMLFRQKDLRAFENPEWQAWEFCKSLFLPKHLIVEAQENGMSSRDIAEIVNLNPAFVEVRLKNLKLI
jgi:hypothetical protein